MFLTIKRVSYRIGREALGVGLLLTAANGWMLSAIFGWYHGGVLSAVGAATLAFPFVMALTGCGVTILEKKD